NLDHPKMDGVSTNLALIFGTLLSSQGADASFVPVSRPSGRFLRFQLSRSDFRFCHPLERAAGAGIRFSRFPFPAGLNITRPSRSP
ncbi:hypothetical protein ACFY8F_21670, partial [Streptomyces tanashiensis]|uniref:hypothetical protein n=1 Tax=Streptomyces tanashiensis TaxID=67367 RepID=UPI0036A4C984